MKLGIADSGGTCDSYCDEDTDGNTHRTQAMILAVETPYVGAGEEEEDSEEDGEQESHTRLRGHARSYRQRTQRDTLRFSK